METIKIKLSEDAPKYLDYLVCEGVIIFAASTKEEALNRKGDTPLFNIMTNKWFNPIVISKTAKLEVGDFCINQKTGEFFKVADKTYVDGLNKNEDDFKVLAMPEQLSSRVLSDIINKKYEDGDEVFLEIRRIDTENFEKADYEIYLRPDNTVCMINKKMVNKQLLN